MLFTLHKSYYWCNELSSFDISPSNLHRRCRPTLLVTGALTWLSYNVSCNEMLNCFSQGACSFEPGLCGWKDTSLGAYKWDRNKGTTIVAGTGPSVDHTCGNTSCKQSNYYFFFYRFCLVQSTESTLESVHHAPCVSDVTPSNSFRW